MQNRRLKILKDKSGASLMFVLGIMLLLMAIGISALAAASANVGFALKQKEHSQIMILDDSVHKNIMYSLQHDTEDADLLSAQLAMAIYEAGENGSEYFDDIQFDGVSLNNGIDLKSGDIHIQKITLSFPVPLDEMVAVTKPIPAIHIPAVYDDAGAETSPETLRSREPKTATVNATMIVTVEINAKGKVVTTRAIYEYNGGKLTDDPEGTHSEVDDDSEYEMVFTDGGYGEWRLIKHENVDTVDATD